MGQLSQVEYGYDDHDSCGKCGMKSNEGCCNTELKLVKVDDSHHWSNPALEISKFQLLADQTQYEKFTFIRDYQTAYKSYHSPPDTRINSIYLHTQTFRL